MIQIPLMLGIDLPRPVPRPIFLSPKISITPPARDVITKAGGDPRALLDRHFYGDWGDVDPEDAAKNNESLKTKGMILSIYWTADRHKIYVLTDPGHETTTIMLPEEY